MFHIMKYTVIEHLRSRIYLSAVGLLILIVGISWMGSTININFNQYYLTVLSFGMNLTEILVVAMALFLPVNHLSLEYERGTAQVIWAKLENRSVYFLGKFFSFLIIIGTLVVIASLFIAAGAVLMGASFSHVCFLGYFVLGQVLEASCVLSLVFFIYAVLRYPVLASLLGLLLIYFSIFLETAREIAIEAEHSLIKFLYLILYYVMPQLDYFNLENQIIYQKNISLAFFLVMTLYAFIFSGVLISLSNIIFERREW